MDEKIAKAQKKRKKLIQKMQDECPHEQIMEADYDKGFMGFCLPPYRVCKACGLAEEGWGCGFWNLSTKGRVPQISRDECQKYILTFCTQEQINKEKFKK